jgi:hypothetical protein
VVGFAVAFTVFLVFVTFAVDELVERGRVTSGFLVLIQERKFGLVERFEERFPLNLFKAVGTRATG